ncbi:Uncharacterized protein MSYG_3002 [Malassezia sympodialis ATCC 42132]|uniref:Store-operated calcium entry-associated regulatory factor n=1 Tax=Malassezia sympodialis (strain ATCC 42132) TaxID=1230383 RepID=A0A1M8A837_MALS4|nr:Uncharacterized protein MSYG_3002 [Malassezia sympodialis ATCC 42132]
MPRGGGKRFPTQTPTHLFVIMQVGRALILGLACLTVLCQGKKASSDRILLDHIKTLTFHRGQMTTARRLDPVPQLTCEGKLCSKVTPRVVQCQNRGDGQWKCEAQLPLWAQLGAVQVSCEGWDNRQDPYVLRGSCALRFELLPANEKMSGSMEALLFSIGFWALFAFIVLSFLHTCLGSEDEPGLYNNTDPRAPPPYQKHDTRRFSSPITRALTAVGLGTVAGYLFRTQTQRVPSTINDPYMPFPGYGTMPHHGVYYGDAATQLQSNTVTSGTQSHNSTGFGDTEIR